MSVNQRLDATYKAGRQGMGKTKGMWAEILNCSVEEICVPQSIFFALKLLLDLYIVTLFRAVYFHLCL